MVPERWPCSEGGAPRTFGRFVAGRVLGRGGMGVVYEAWHPQHGAVALKVLSPILAHDPRARARFRREAEALTRARHSHVVAILDASFGTEPYLALELLDGETLAARLTRGPLALAEILALFPPLLAAVGAAHRQGVIHRDLKPANVVLARRRRGVDPVLIDFGVARLCDPAAAVTTLSESLVGTPRCLSPEQLWNAHLVSPLSDQYALGVMLYQCAAGRPPFTGASHHELVDAILHAQLPPPSRHAPVPAALDSLVLRAMSRDPARRFADVGALADALAALPHQSP
jgi:eukaryotic-like serine/threonine-protein kinase